MIDRAKAEYVSVRVGRGMILMGDRWKDKVKAAMENKEAVWKVYWKQGRIF